MFEDFTENDDRSPTKTRRVLKEDPIRDILKHRERLGLIEDGKLSKDDAKKQNIPIHKAKEHPNIADNTCQDFTN